MVCVCDRGRRCCCDCYYVCELVCVCVRNSSPVINKTNPASVQCNGSVHPLQPPSQNAIETYARRKNDDTQLYNCDGMCRRHRRAHCPHDVVAARSRCVFLDAPPPPRRIRSQSHSILDKRRKCARYADVARCCVAWLWTPAWGVVVCTTATLRADLCAKQIWKLAACVVNESVCVCVCAGRASH